MAPWAVAAIVVFVIVDAALVWWALASVRADSGTPQGEVLPSVPPAQTTEPTPETSAEPDATAASASSARPTVVLAALDANLAYRGLVGRCPDAAATLEVTTDGGATWVPAFTAGLTDLQSVEPADADIVSMVARDPAGCGIGRYRSYVQGADWEPTGELEPTWYLDGAVVFGPGGDSSQCGASDGEAVQVAGASEGAAAVLCASGAVHTTTDGGGTWSSAPVPDRIVAIASTFDGYLVAVTGDGCRGIRTVALAPDATPGACLEADVTPGTTALDVASDGTVWVWSGRAFARSDDGGATW